MSGHLVNTFLLVASLALTARIAATQRPLFFRGQKVVGAAIGVALAGMLLLGVSGAIAALGDTLFPSRSLAEGLSRDFSPTAHFLIRLRLLHPFLAVSVGVYLVFLAGMLSRLRPAPDVRRFAVGIGGLFAVELGLGVLNVGLLAPIWMQLIHLLVADLLWMQLVLLVLAALSVPVPQNPFRLADDSPLREAPGRAGV
jgi:heme A synthase